MRAIDADGHVPEPTEQIARARLSGIAPPPQSHPTAAVAETKRAKSAQRCFGLRA